MKRDDTQFYLTLASFVGMVGIYVMLYKTYKIYQQYQPQIEAAQTKLAQGSALFDQIGALFGQKTTPPS